ncbi:PleD family two-component system response regulator [Actinoplanes sp. NPDC051859]|uniref:PleD family two-component system response regulator n=1 Tax=Actinoplanes sp. NPDC051859 TaxID=3363909 RepID=UPI0037A9B71A
MATILIADDDPDIREVLTLIFSKAGHRVLLATDGLEALQAAKLGLPDLVLTDMDMPNLDGAQLCLALREHPQLRDVPLALLSGTLYRDDPRVRDVGSCAVMIEPLPNRNVLAAAERLLSLGRHPHTDTCACTPALLAPGAYAAP